MGSKIKEEIVAKLFSRGDLILKVGV